MKAKSLLRVQNAMHWESVHYRRTQGKEQAEKSPKKRNEEARTIHARGRRQKEREPGNSDSSANRGINSAEGIRDEKGKGTQLIGYR